MRFAALLLVALSAPVTTPTPPSWTVHFSPNGGCEDAVVTLIDSAHSSVHLMAYGFTLPRVADALVARRAHGVSVTVVLDRSDRATPLVALLRSRGVLVYIDTQHRIMHDKVVIVDGATFATGSFNFTTSAERSNAENLLIETDPAKAALYEANYETHRQHAEFSL